MKKFMKFKLKMLEKMLTRKTVLTIAWEKIYSLMIRFRSLSEFHQYHNSKTTTSCSRTSKIIIIYLIFGRRELME